MGSSPTVTANSFTGNQDAAYFNPGPGTQIGTNIVSWRMLPIARGLGLERFSQTGMRAELTDKGQPEMRYNIATYL